MRCGDEVKGREASCRGPGRAIAHDLYALRRQSEGGDASYGRSEGGEASYRRSEGGEASYRGPGGVPQISFFLLGGGGVKFAFQHAVSGQRSVLEAS